VNGALAAVGFLTRLPVPRHAHDLERAAAAQGWFPVVGLALGGLLLAADRILAHSLPEASVAVLLVVLLIILTGAIHLDGVSDAADGLLAGRSRVERLAIMRDVHTGSFGVTAIVSVLATKWAGLVALPRDVRFEALLLAPCLARWGMTLAVASLPAARPDGLAATFHRASRPLVTVTAGAVALAASVVLLGAGGALAFVAATLVAAGGAVVARRAVGGMTGDICGAIVEIGEGAALLFIAALARHGWLEAYALA